MPLARVPGQTFDALVDHEDGRRGRSRFRGRPLNLSLGVFMCLRSTLCHHVEREASRFMPSVLGGRSP